MRLSVLHEEFSALYENYQHAGWFKERIDYLKEKYPTTVGPFGSKNFAYRWAKDILKNAWFGRNGSMSYFLKSGSNKQHGEEEVGYVEIHSTAHRTDDIKEGEVYLHLAPSYEHMANVYVPEAMRPKGWVGPVKKKRFKPKKVKANKSKRWKPMSPEARRAYMKLYKDIKNLWKDGWRAEEIAELLDADIKVVTRIVKAFEED